MFQLFIQNQTMASKDRFLLLRKRKSMEYLDCAKKFLKFWVFCCPKRMELSRQSWLDPQSRLSSACAIWLPQPLFLASSSSPLTL